MNAYVIFILVTIILVTILVVRVSEISTSIKALEKCVIYSISRDECDDIINHKMTDIVTHDTLKSILRIVK